MRIEVKWMSTEKLNSKPNKKTWNMTLMTFIL